MNQFETEPVEPMPEVADLILEKQTVGQWEIGSWNGLEMFTCTMCGWDTVDGKTSADAKQANCDRCSPAIPEPTPVTVPIYDRYNQLITKIETS